MTRRVEAEIEIASSRADVWTALTDPRELVRWFPLEANIQTGAGATLRMSWGEDFEWNHRIEVWDPPRHLRTGYEVPPTGETAPGKAPAEGTTAEPETVSLSLDIHVELHRDRTRIRLVHSGFPETPIGTKSTPASVGDGDSSFWVFVTTSRITAERTDVWPGAAPSWMARLRRCGGVS